MANQQGAMENMVSWSSLSAYYKGKKVLVTGHTGFKGSWLCTWLVQFGATVKGYALPPAYTSDLYENLVSGQLIRDTLADIRDKETLHREVAEFAPDVVFHLAAQPLVRRSYEIPVETFETNVIGTANLLDAVRHLNSSCSVVVVTTDKVYHNLEQGQHYTESDRLGGYDPYSASKACTELLVDAFRNSFFNISDAGIHRKLIATARAGNVIGGGDWSTDRIIPDIIRALSSGETIKVRNAGAVRPWQHVLEPLAGYLVLAYMQENDPRTYSTAFNFGPVEEGHLSVKDLVELAIASWGGGSWSSVHLAQQPHEAGLLKLDISKAIETLGWYPRLPAKEAIDWTLNWYKQPNEQKLAFSFKQINEYMQL